MNDDQYIIGEFFSYLNDKAFPCVGAKAAIAGEQVKCMVAEHMACPKDDGEILQFLYRFTDDYRTSSGLYHSAVILFRGPEICNEEMFDFFLWQRIQHLSDMDARNYPYDNRVCADPASPGFSFSLKQEAFFIVGLHPSSSRLSRRFKYPALVFNPHAQFEKLRDLDRYERMKQVVRKRDILYSGSVNPMLEDFGKTSEAYQYSGRKYDKDWQCPFKSQHGKDQHHSATERDILYSEKGPAP